MGKNRTIYVDFMGCQLECQGIHHHAIHVTHDEEPEPEQFELHDIVSISGEGAMYLLDNNVVETLKHAINENIRDLL